MPAIQYQKSTKPGKWPTLGREVLSSGEFFGGAAEVVVFPFLCYLYYARETGPWREKCPFLAKSPRKAGFRRIMLLGGYKT